MAWAILSSVIMTSIFLVLRVFLILLGILAVPLGILLHDRKTEKFPKWLWLWDNDQDGFKGTGWFKKRLGKDNWYTWFQWSAIRNPANNMRYLSWVGILDTDVEDSMVWKTWDWVHPTDMKRSGRTFDWFIMFIKVGKFWYPSLHMCYIWNKEYTKYCKLRMGWKVNPYYILYGNDDGKVIPRGFAVQVQPYKTNKYETRDYT